MRFLTELFCFVLIAGAAILVGAGLLWVVGQPFQLEFPRSVWLAAIGLLFVFPAVVNIWIMFRGGGGESPVERLLAGIRGFGMLLVATAAALKFALASGWKPALVCFAIGTAMLFMSIPPEMWIRHRRMQRLTKSP